MYQDSAFTVLGLNGATIEQLIVCQNPETQSVVIVFVKIAHMGWCRYFLDAGYGFWQNDFDNLATIDPTLASNCDDSFDYLDLTDTLGVAGAAIVAIWCQPEAKNCSIFVEITRSYSEQAQLAPKVQLVLTATHPEEFDSDSKLLMT